MPRAGRQENDESRRGVALIVVLGFLSILILMAVAFLTQARMERMVSGMTLEAMRGRQLVRTAVNAAMNDYSVYLWNESLVAPSLLDDQVFASAPPEASSRMSNPRTIGETGISLLAGEVYDWIPRRYLQDPVAMDVVSNAEWIVVREKPGDPQSRILGRYAYVCFDMSGGIDANLIAQSENVAAQDARAITNRIRRSVRDVPMGALAETANASEFKRLRKGWKGFDSLYSLIRLTDGLGNDGQELDGPSTARWSDERKEVYGAGLSSNLVNDLVPYSLSAFRGGRYNSGFGTWSPLTKMDGISGSQWSELLASFTFQFAAGWPDWIAKAFNDYVSPSPTPAGTDYPSPKNVPMFNEMIVSYGVKETDDPLNPGYSEYALDLGLTFEFWYPFPSTDNDNAGSFTLDPPTVDVGPLPNPIGAEDVYVQAWLIGPTNAIAVKLDAASVPPPPMNVEAKWNSGKPYLPVPTNFSYQLKLARKTGSVDPLPPGATLHVAKLRMNNKFYLKKGGEEADMLPASTSFEFGAADLVKGGEPKIISFGVRDPRFNYLAGNWRKEDPTPGEMNAWYASPSAGATPGENSKKMAEDEGLCMYCRNAPMESPAEMGFISNGKEWGTLDICRIEGVELLSKLVGTNLYKQMELAEADGNGFVVYTNGTINPNTRSTNVLTAAFIDLPANEVPNQPTDRFINPNYEASTISEGLAQYLASRIAEESDVSKLPAAERFTMAFQAGSDWARIPAMQQNKDLAKMGLNNNQRESLIRNTWGLFAPESSLFTVVVIAQAIKEGPDGVGIWSPEQDQISGERRAVALVWRDPFKTGAGTLHHEMFVRMFRYLND